MKIIKLIVVIVMLLCGVSVAAAGQGSVKTLERIAIEASENEARFVGAESGKTFFVKGFNYVRLRASEGKANFDHSTFDAETKTTKAAYDPEKAEAMFSTLSKAGYNTVRVFVIGRSTVNPGIGGDYDTTKAVYEPYMENFVDFLRRATRHGMYVFPTFGDGGVPLNAYYREHVRGKGNNKNVFVLTRQGLELRRKHITSFLSYIKQKAPELLPTLLGLECQNEAYLRADQWPFTEKEGKFKAANGKTYDLSSTEERQALMDEGYRYYHNSIAAAVKRIDPDMLVSEGVFVPRAVGKDPVKHEGVWPGKTKDERYPPTLTAIGTGSLDFLDVHFYHVTANPKDVASQFRRNLGSTNFFTPQMKEIRKKTPVIMGEFGAFDHHEKTFAAAVDNLVQVRDLANKENMNGMLFWTYDCQEQARLYHATDDWKLFYRKMGDFEKKEDDILVGVNYFAGWWKELPNKWHGQGWNINQPDWRPKFSGRVPLLGQYNTQATMDKEIEAASSHGVDFFLILYYFPQPGAKQAKHAPMLNRGLETFMASAKADKMKFCIEYCNAPDFSARNEKEWDDCVKVWVAAMKHPSYLRVDGRLVFKVHGISEFLKTNNRDYKLCQKRLDTLRNAVRVAGLGEMIIGVGVSGHTPPLGKGWPPAKLFDFTGTYMCVPDIKTQKAEYPYATLAKQARTTRKNRLSDPIPWMPYLAAGWNPRPWTYPKAPDHYQRFFEFPTGKEFTNELKAMKKDLEKYSSLGLPRKDGTCQKAFTIYAWNEFGEGGIVAPTEGKGTMMLDAIDYVFESSAGN